ncbi:MAG: hypothetical protein ACI9PU_001262 [Ascidiaceihabitans sp.]|jgi:hypothetical protein|tara:strand:+ start:5118 stop:5339 length:222 start_codon:yes stop_codon:yes gene_type:complete
MNALDIQLLAAHDADDTAALIVLYTQAADQSRDIDATCFYLTHAYVFALEQGSPMAEVLRARLISHGREPAAD